jgi:two-component system chemotaxis family response regulator WspR
MAMEQQALLDELTGVVNREGFDLRLAEVWRKAQPEHVPLSLLLIDIDYFKAYNKSHTRRMGDECLKKIATALAGSMFRPTDQLARWGEDEFAILLPASEEKGALVVAARARNQVNQLSIRHSGGEGGMVTVSIGVAQMAPAPDHDAAELIELADGALKQAKRSGRDCIVSQEWIS